MRTDAAFTAPCKHPNVLTLWGPDPGRYLDNNKLGGSLPSQLEELQNLEVL